MVLINIRNREKETYKIKFYPLPLVLPYCITIDKESIHFEQTEVSGS